MWTAYRFKPARSGVSQLPSEMTCCTDPVTGSSLKDSNSQDIRITGSFRHWLFTLERCLDIKLLLIFLIIVLALIMSVLVIFPILIIMCLLIHQHLVLLVIVLLVVLLFFVLLLICKVCITISCLLPIWKTYSCV